MTNPLDIIPSVVNLVANYENNKHNEQMAQQVHEWDVQSAEQANQWSIEQWNRENAYNTPSAQMSRLAEAGINPALAYSNGTFNQAATSPQVSQTAPAKMAHMMPWQTDPMLMSNLEVNSSQSKVLDAQAKAIEDENRRKNELQGYNVKLTEAETKHFDALSSYLGELEAYTHENKELVKVMGETASLEFNKKMATLNSDIAAIKAQNKITQATADNIYETITSNINMLKAMAHEAQTRAGVNQEQVNYYKSLENYYDNSLSALNASQKSLNDAMSSYTGTKENYVPLEQYINAIGMGCNVIRTGIDAYGTIATGGKKPDIVIGGSNSSSSSSLPWPSTPRGLSSSVGNTTVTGNWHGSILHW